MLKKIINVIYILTVLICLFCVPLSAIFVIVKMCGVGGMSWLGACLPFIVSLAVSPFLLISKFLIDGRSK